MREQSANLSPRPFLPSGARNLRIRKRTVKSISHWKNVYLPECSGCAVREQCGGFFQSATKRHSTGIRPVAALAR